MQLCRDREKSIEEMVEELMNGGSSLNGTMTECGRDQRIRGRQPHATDARSRWHRAGTLGRHAIEAMFFASRPTIVNPCDVRIRY